MEPSKTQDRYCISLKFVTLNYFLWLFRVNYQIIMMI